MSATRYARLALVALAALAVSCGRSEQADKVAAPPDEPASGAYELRAPEYPEPGLEDMPMPEPEAGEWAGADGPKGGMGGAGGGARGRAAMPMRPTAPPPPTAVDPAPAATSTVAWKPASPVERGAMALDFAGDGDDGYLDATREEMEERVADRFDQPDKAKADIGAARDEKPASELDPRLVTGERDLRVRQLDRPDPWTYQAPDRLLPRMFYFENTYLGGSAAYRERLRRLDDALAEGERPYRLAFGAPQPLDAPSRAGLEVTAELDAPYFDQPRRVFLQVGLKGSARHGWRRPPLDVMVVIDPEALSARGDTVSELVIELLQRLGPADRLGVIIAGLEPVVFTELSHLERARTRLASTIDGLVTPPGHGHHPGGLAEGMRRAGALLSAAADDVAIVPGTQTVLVVTSGDDARRIGAATVAAHDLTVQGAVTSIFALDRSPERAGWWQVANAGHGNYHHLGGGETGALVTWELESLARVVARLVRVNIRLGKTAGAIRVLGTRVLDSQEVAQVKAREVATDQNLSRAMGITSDRGEDDDGVQTVIPYFYGDDSHVILVELWVEGPGPIADVTVRYKDMVNLGNATARTSARLDSRPRAETPEAELIRSNVRGFELAAALERTAHRVRWSDPDGARRELARARSHAAATGAQDVAVVAGFERLVGDERWRWDDSRRAVLAESLRVAAERKVGEPNPE